MSTSHSSQERQDSPATQRSCSVSRLRVVVVGGGTAGWMTAVTLRRRLGCRVELIESKMVPGVGVGEATIPALVDWLENMGIEEDRFLNECCGTYKLAIRFDNWVQPKHRYWHPFGICGAKVSGVDLIHLWKIAIRDGLIPSTLRYADFSLQKQLAASERSPRVPGWTSICANYAFHLDASRFAAFLATLAKNEGVMHRLGDVIGAERTADGNISRLMVDQQPPIEGDLFIDCTGFAALLGEKQLGERWDDWSDQLLCDTAVAARLHDTNSSLPPYTISTGSNAGWTWQIPLRDLTGTGYVYSSSHISEDQACRELASQIGQDPDQLSFRRIKMRVGRRQNAWSHNCVCIGLSAGFVEPLESTGIFLIQRAIDELVAGLQDSRSSAPSTRQRFNQQMGIVYDEIRDFVLLHYLVSQRDDTAFWKDARSVPVPDSLRNRMNRYATSGDFSDLHEDSVFAEANHHFIMAGADRSPATSPIVRDRLRQLDTSLIEQILFSVHRQNAHLVNQMPLHRDFIRQAVRCNNLLEPETPALTLAP